MTIGGFNIGEFISNIFKAGEAARAPESKEPENIEVSCRPSRSSASTDMECDTKHSIADEYMNKVIRWNKDEDQKLCDSIMSEPSAPATRFLQFFVTECDDHSI